MDKINQEVKKLIEENPVALATVDANGQPNVIAVAYVKVVSVNQIIITDNFMSQTRKNLLKNDRVCLAVWGKDWNGYKMVGRAEYHAEGEWKTMVEGLPENKDLAAKAAVLVTIEKIIKLK